ncbi:hypothetical protein [Streptomyces albidoflavus]|uniref:hypothetical protein n=1 Tax=Streptomyces albidoflavus TaxID=1886 RepID=UPI00188A6E36|nr:hypothetical protein [Streptomyces albidoflavus]MBF4138134.1 hypothetical protein [Streptomyces albidoflavus]
MMMTIDRSGALSSLPLVTVMSGTTALLAAGVLTLRSGALLDGGALQPLGVLICCGVFLVATWVAHVVFRRLGFHRRALTVPSVAASMVVVIAVVWGVAAASAQVWKHPWTRYSDEFGGPGACLADTSYGDRWHVLVRGVGEGGPMEVWPGAVEGSQEATPRTPLRLRAEGRRALNPADEASTRILRDHGCG